MTDKRDDSGKFLEKPAGAAPNFTPERARELALRRHSLARQAVADALQSHPDAVTDADGLRIIAESQAVLAADPDAGSQSTTAANWIWSKGGYDEPSMQAGGKSSEGPSISIEIRSDEVAAALAERVAGAINEDSPGEGGVVVEGESREV